MAYRLDEVKEDAIHSWVMAALGLEAKNVIWDRGGPRPDPPYALLNILIGPQQIGEAEERYKELDTFIYAMRWTFTLTVGIYGGNGYLGQIANLTKSLTKPSARATLRQAGLAVWGSEPPVDLSTLLDTQFEDRAAVDILFAYGEAIEDDAVGEIQSVDMTGRFASLPPPPDENTVILYCLDGTSGNVIDSSDNKLHGIAYKCIRGEPGVYGKSFRFAANDSWINALSEGLSDLWRTGLGDTGTIDFYFKASSNNFWSAITGFFFDFNKTQLFSYINWLRFRHDGTDLIFDRKVSGGVLEAKINMASLNLGTDWHYFRLTWTLNRLEIYIDDELKAYDDGSVASWQDRPLAVASIGAVLFFDDLIPYLDGWMDYFRLSNIVRESTSKSVREINIKV